MISLLSQLSPYFLGVFSLLITFLIAYFKWQYQYWERKNFNTLEANFPWGNLGSPINRTDSIGVVVTKQYEIMKQKKWKHGGLYTIGNPTYMVLDLDYVKNILTKDFQYFTDRGFYYNEKSDPLSAHLFAVGGTKWRNLRTKLSPTFTSGKMKMMFETLAQCEKNLQEVMEKFYEEHEGIDIKEVLGCFTTDIIGSCAFGLECNTFKDEDSLFRKYGKKVLVFRPVRLALIALALNLPKVAKFFGVCMVDQDVIEFFLNVVKDTVEHREKNNVKRNDFLQMLIDLRNNELVDDDGHKSEGTSLTIEEIAAQSFLFFFAGFETSSTTMTFALYELAKNQEIQAKLRKEVDEVLRKHSGKITYDAIQEMKYMNQVVNETLRKYPPIPFVTRQCVKDYKVPNDNLIIEKGTKVFIPILGIHHDSDYYPDPEKFDPDRFTEENKNSRHPYAHIPFGEGPRICIGLRFGLMQSKFGLVSLLNKYRFTVNKKTQEPLKMKPYSLILAADGEIWLDAQKI